MIGKKRKKRKRICVYIGSYKHYQYYQGHKGKVNRSFFFFSEIYIILSLFYFEYYFIFHYHIPYPFPNVKTGNNISRGGRGLWGNSMPKFYPGDFNPPPPQQRGGDGGKKSYPVKNDWFVNSLVLHEYIINMTITLF